jgi:ABC-type uncharacterized transport system substrate-binding protein
MNKENRQDKTKCYDGVQRNLLASHFFKFIYDNIQNKTSKYRVGKKSREEPELIGSTPPY